MSCISLACHLISCISLNLVDTELPCIFVLHYVPCYSPSWSWLSFVSVVWLSLCCIWLLCYLISVSLILVTLLSSLFIQPLIVTIGVYCLCTSYSVQSSLSLSTFSYPWLLPNLLLLSGYHEGHNMRAICSITAPSPLEALGKTRRSQIPPMPLIPYHWRHNFLQYIHVP